MYPISNVPSPGTYLIGQYADGSLDLMRVISEPRIHPARTFKTTIDHHIPEWWDLEVEIPNSPPDSKGHHYLTPQVLETTKRANDEDFEAFIIEQKQNLMDIRKDYGTDPQRMVDWFRRGIDVAYEWWKEFRERRGIDPPPPLSQVAPGGQRTLFNNLGNNEGEDPLKGEKVWTMTADRYQLLMGVHQPWIAEISPAQYAGMSKRARNEYDKKRSVEWQASADIKNEWSEKVTEAYVQGKFKLDDPDVSKEAKDAVWAYERDLKEEREKTTFEKATSENRVQNIDELEIGDRVFTLMYREYGDVIKKFKKSVRIRWEKPLYGGTTESTLDVGYLQWWEYNDLVERAKEGLPIRPVRGPVQQPPAVVQSNGGEVEWKWQKAAKGPSVGEWKEKYDNLLPHVKKVIDKIIISKPFLDAIELDRKPGEILDSYAFHWGTALSNADEYRGGWRAPEKGKRILRDEEVRLVAQTSSRPWLTFNRPYWEEFVKKVVPGYRQIKEYRKIYTPNELMDIVARGDYNYMHDPEQLEPGYMKEWQLDPHTFFIASRLLPESERGMNRDLEHFVNSDIKDGTAVAAVLDDNGNLWYFRRYQEHHGWLVTVDMPGYWKQLEKEERGSAIETDTLNEYLGIQEKPWEEKGYETEADMLADQEEWDRAVQEGGAAHAVRIRQGFHRQAQRIPYSDVVRMEMDWRKRGYDVIKEPVEKQGDLWDLYVKAMKPEKKKTGTLDDYLYGGEGR